MARRRDPDRFYHPETVMARKTGKELSAPPDTTRTQITRWLRQSIQDGTYSVGMRLPPERELAKRFQTSNFTVNCAMESLVADGLLERRRRLGTFVRQATVPLICAGLYHGGSLEGGPNSAFYRALADHLKSKLSARETQIHLWTNNHERDEAGLAPAGLIEAVEKRRIQALFITNRARTSRAWIERLNVAETVYSSMAGARGQVYFEASDFATLGVEALARSGVRRLAVITNTPEGPSENTDDPAVRFHQALRRAAERHGLEARPAWRACTVTDSERWSEYETFGYREFKRIFSLPETERPDGVLVYPDTIARGTIAAMLETGLHPRAAFHRNVGVPLFAPFPYLAVAADPRDAAAAMVRQVEHQLNGIAYPTPEILSHRVMEDWR